MDDLMYEIRDWFKYADWNQVIIGIVCVVFVLFCVVFVFQPTSPITVYGFLVGKQYTPSTSSTGVGLVADGAGGTKTVVTTNTTSEKWELIINNDGEYKTYEVSPKIFYSVKENTNISISCRTGKWIPVVNCE
jgi:hypothetical protein